MRGTHTHDAASKPSLISTASSYDKQRALKPSPTQTASRAPPQTSPSKMAGMYHGSPTQAPQRLSTGLAPTVSTQATPAVTDSQPHQPGAPLLQAPRVTKHTARDLHDIIHASGQYNFRGLRIPLQTHLNIPAWRASLEHYVDNGIVEFLEFGWPIGFDSLYLPVSSRRNHNSANTYSAAVDQYVNKEVTLGATQGPFRLPPFGNDFVASPLQTVPKGDEGDRRVVVDLSFPPGSSVNDGIPAKQYLGHPLHFTLPSHEAFESLIRRKGPGCQLYKRDLSRAYRQIPVDPYDYHMLGFTWGIAFISMLYFRSGCARRPWRAKGPPTPSPTSTQHKATTV